MKIKKIHSTGRLGGSVSWVSAFGSGRGPGVLESSSALDSLLRGESAFPSASLSFCLSWRNNYSLKKK